MNLYNFLRNNVQGAGSYALISIYNKIIPVYFDRYDTGKDVTFVESICELYMVDVVSGAGKRKTKVFKQLAKELCPAITTRENLNDVIEEYVKPMIVNGIAYDVFNLDTLPFLHEEVDDVVLVSRRECLLFMLEEARAADKRRRFRFSQ